MKFLSLSLVSVFLVGCAHIEESPKTVHFPFAKDLLQKVQKSQGRMPASVGSLETSEMSPRRIYFSALYHQYLTLGQHLEEKNNLKFCPQFHHDKIETDAGHTSKVSLFPTKNISPEGKAYFPELAFNKNFSLKDYHAVIRTEIDTLCEDGVSDNFYKFDNLVTHYAGKKAFHQNPQAMVSVLKIPVFANFYLVKMLENSPVSFTSSPEKRFIGLTQTHWFENYVTEASLLRNNFIKNKMVQR